MEHRNTQRLKEFLARAWALEPGWEANVLTYDHDGLRIAELGASIHRPDGTGQGFSYMQSDRDCWPVIFTAERFLVEVDTPIEDFGSDTYVDIGQEAEHNLLTALGLPVPAWEDRR